MGQHANIAEMDNETLVATVQDLHSEIVARLKQAYETSSWLGMGYTSWDSYVESEFGELQLTPTAGTRRDVIVAYRLAGMSTTAIASATQLSAKTVRGELANADLPDNLPVWGVNGKSYLPGRKNTEKGSRDHD